MDRDTNSAWWYSDAGIGVEQEESLYFIDSSVEVIFYRHYSSPCLLDINTIAKEAVCSSTSAQKDVGANILKIAEACDREWNSELNILSQYASHNFQNSVYYSHPQPLSSSRAPRAISLVAVSAFVSIFTSLITSGLGLYSAFATHNSNAIKESLTDYIKFQHGEKMMVALGLENNREATSVFLEYACEKDLYDSNFKVTNAASKVLKSYTDAVVQESLSLSFGTWPRNMEFLESLLKLCTETGANTKHFCLDAIYSSQVNFRFLGSVSENGTLSHRLLINMPIQATSLRRNSFYKLINLGFWASENFMRFDLPASVIKSDNLYFEITKESCLKNFCNIDLISIGKHSSCLSSLFEENTTEDCNVVIVKEPESCDIRRLSNSTIIQAREATVLLDSDEGPLTIPLNKGNLMVSLPGKLLCYSRNDSETFLLPKPMVSHYSSLLPGQIEVSHAINTSKLLELEAKLSEGLKIEKRLRSLEFSDDRLEVNGAEYPTLWVIIIASFSVLGVQLMLCFLRSVQVMPALKFLARFTKGLRKETGAPAQASLEENIESPCLVAVVDQNVSGEISAELFHKETSA
uniref:Envelope protein n=1 Tax=Oikopleura dioica TaxID=34765 RepID=Q6GV73_OIKDI|nr:envelope protein [Oikopleura dioica]